MPLYTNLENKNFSYKIRIILFFIIVFFITRQFPFAKYSFIMNFSIIFFFMLNFNYIVQNINRNIILKFLILTTIIMLIILLYYSELVENNIFYAVRFFIILILIVLAYMIKPEKKYIDIFMILVLLQSIIVISIEFLLVMLFNKTNYISIRSYFINNNFGDIYTLTGSLWKVQLKGNSLIPFAFFVSFIAYKGLKKIILSSIFLFAIICAGNFAFILGVAFFIALYFMYKTFNKPTLENLIKKSFIAILITLIFSIPAYEYVIGTAKEKSISSNPIRFDQMNVLINDANKNILTILFGRGLGHTISIETNWRDYKNKVYYELQTLYIINQTGIFVFTFFVLLNIILALYFIKYKLLLIVYMSYIFYAFFNPYLFDTNHIVVIIILLSLRSVLDERKYLFNNSNLLSGYGIS